MPTPDFVLQLRSRIGHDPIPLVGVTAVIVKGDRVLLGRRSDNGVLAPITGIVDPGEEPADAAVREAMEEAGIVIRPVRLAWVHQLPRTTHLNGDLVDYLDLVFRCEWVSGEPRPVDGELSEVGWYDLDALPALERGDQRERIARAVAVTGPAVFEGGV
ncbi:NTP pyrophosphohydrolase [Microbacterium mangrovi]|uniref:NTP pyrophosphohydrolase n=1 Tax=Microbacterium mangrovi TaxID=1348253 RepID=A0A0B2A0C8_9MICO|nr:NUDIX domain-containing protein [Microbacterium mangrovi]KHK96915.1 NTP pyrophosphohydrolase [Microbacterium mangrovi]